MDFGLGFLARGALHVTRASAGVFASIAFLALAIASIQYDETVAPKLASLADTCSTLLADVGRRLMIDRVS